MDFEEKKENIQPLRVGRNVEQLEHAFESVESWEESRKLQEEEIEKYVGDDPLQLWYDYMSWMEQTNFSSVKPMILEDAVRRCVQKFENDPRYIQDHRFIKLCIKYIDTQPSPVELYNELYNRGVGTLCSELYIAWAYYYDAVDNFAKTEEVFQKGLRAGAEPKADLEQAHTIFGFSMSQRLLYKDECSKKKFQSSLDERRSALVSLRATQKKNVGSVRTGLAVKSFRPGVVNQENIPSNGLSRNAPSNAIVYSDVPGSSGEASSIVRPFSSVHDQAENIIESARLTKSQSAHKKSVLFPSHHAPSFDIPMDEEPLQTMPVLVDNYTRGIQLPARFCRKNKPQTPFVLSICVGDPKEWAIPMYDKIRLYCRASGPQDGGDGEKTEYSPEELRAYRYLTRKGIENNFTQQHRLIWANEYDVGIRLHPLHVRESKSNEPVKKCKDILPTEVPGTIFQTKIQEMYANQEDEKSIEELLTVKWYEGKIKRCVDRRYYDDVDPVDMDETHVESKRISMGGARFSLAPSMVTDGTGGKPQMRQRRSIFPSGGMPAVALITEETEEELRNRSSVLGQRTANEQKQPQMCALQDPQDSSEVVRKHDEAVSRKRLSDDMLLPSSKKEDTKMTPLKNAFECGQNPESDLSPQPAVASEKFQIFVGDSDESDGREELIFAKPSSVGVGEPAFYPNDTCSTQVFNMFVKNISTPVGPIRKPQPMPGSTMATGTSKRLVVFADDDEADDEHDDAGGSELKAQTKVNAPLRDIADGRRDIGKPPSNTVTISTAESKINDENCVPTVEGSTPPSTCTSTSSACSSTQSHKQLSTIMERTETSTTSATGATKSSVDTQHVLPESNFSSPGEEPNHPNPPTSAPPKELFFQLPPAASNEEPKGFGIHIDSTETMANIPLLLKRDLPPVAIATDDKENECVLRETTEAVKTTGTGGPSIGSLHGALHGASSVLRNLSGGGKHGGSPAAGSDGIFQLPDEPTTTTSGLTVGPRNLSHMVQRELDVNSIMSFRMTTERTNTVPMQLVKPLNAILPEMSSNAAPTVCASNGANIIPKHGNELQQSTVRPIEFGSPEMRKNNLSLLDQLDATFSPKPETVARADASKCKENSFNSNNLMKPIPTNTAGAAGMAQDHFDLEPLSVPSYNDLSLLANAPIKVEPSLNLDASLELPKFTLPKLPEPPKPSGKEDTHCGGGAPKVVLDEFASPLPPAKRNGGSSLDDINTAVFSLNINQAMNSTIIQDDFKTPRSQAIVTAGSSDGAPLPPATFKIAEVKGGITNHPSLLAGPPAEVIDLSEVTESVPTACMLPPLPPSALATATATTGGRRVSPFQDVYDGDTSIYHPRVAIPQEDEERWDEIDDQFDPQMNNEYRHKTPVDPECTVQQINACFETDEVDPFNKPLRQAFLDRLDFMSYIAELPNCTLMNKIQPLRKGARLPLADGEDAFEVQQRIGKGAYGTVFSGLQASTGQKIALKQERPANLWEYYICLEIRSRLTNPEILPGFMSIDHAFVGNNASIFVSAYSRYGNILDVCNLINKATNRNVDEFIAMIISAQILSIVDHLHSCQIIHADIKPDNFLFMSPINLDDKSMCVQLIDFGESIDMQLFEKDVTFKRIIKTDGFTCIEMREDRPWTYQPDLFGVAATSHAILFGRYMQVQKNIVNWGIKTSMPRYFKKSVWENYFTVLLNIRDCDHLPNLQNLRRAFLEEVALHEKYIRGKVAEFNQSLNSLK